MLTADTLTFGYLLPTREAVMFDRPAAAPLLELGEQAEQLGFEAIWAGDGPLARPRHDTLAMLAALAARTQTVMLGTGVLLGALRPALLLAQTASTVDLISEGRFILVSCAVSSLHKYGMLWHAKNWTAQAGAGVD